MRPNLHLGEMEIYRETTNALQCILYISQLLFFFYTFAYDRRNKVYDSSNLNTQ